MVWSKWNWICGLWQWGPTSSWWRQYRCPYQEISGYPACKLDGVTRPRPFFVGGSVPNQVDVGSRQTRNGQHPPLGVYFSSGENINNLGQGIRVSKWKLDWFLEFTPKLKCTQFDLLLDKVNTVLYIQLSDLVWSQPCTKKERRKPEHWSSSQLQEALSGIYRHWL